MRTLRRLVVLILLLGLGAGFYCFQAYYTMRSDAEQTVFIAPRTGVQDILIQLNEAGLIPPLPVVAVPLMMTHELGSLKAGEYHFAAGTTPAEVISKIARGEVVVHKLTIPEGWNSWQVRAALMAEPLLSGELPPGIPEGSVLPDTMHFSRGEPRMDVLTRMQQAQIQLVRKLWTARPEGFQLQTPGELITLASIVEKETGEVDERAMVAGVFLNRLRLGMPLQSDPTVVYGIEIAQGGKPMGRELSRADLKADTPYNTYVHTGFPISPICNPGRKALEAVMNPAQTDALYFVATGTGGHRFAATLKEHEANVVAYRRTLKEAAAATAAGR